MRHRGDYIGLYGLYRGDYIGLYVGLHRASQGGLYWAIWGYMGYIWGYMVPYGATRVGVRGRRTCGDSDGCSISAPRAQGRGTWQ